MSYQQISQELRITSRIGELADYAAGLFYIHHKYSVDSKTGWGDDAGAWFANAAQYNLLDSDGDGRYLLTQSLAASRKLATTSLDNTSQATFSNIDWHLTPKASVVTGLRVSREDRKSKGFSLMEQDGYGQQLNASVSSFGVELGGFDSYYNSAANPVWVRDGFALSSTADTTGATLVAPGATALTTSAISGARLTSANAAADAAALKYFRAASWSALSNRQKQQLAYYELGVKADILSGDLQLSADVFLSRLKNYQQSSAVVDEFTTRFNDDGQTYYTTVAANVPRIQVHGLELDGSYSGIPFTTLDFSAAYNVARYKDFPSAPQTPENGFTGAPPYQDLTGEILPGAAKYTANLGADFRHELFGDYDFHANFNANYTSRYNSDITVSSYSWIEDYTIFDVGIGVGRQDRAFDVTLLVKNLTNAEGKAYNWLNGTLDTTPRWAGVVVSGRL